MHGVDVACEKPQIAEKGEKGPMLPANSRREVSFSRSHAGVSVRLE